MLSSFLKASNLVQGFYYTYPGIFVPKGKTLTIKGTGSLTAKNCNPEAWFSGAEIGGGMRRSCGNIVIEGGTITAIGGGSAAGIGEGYSFYEDEDRFSCGNITITGRTVTATGGESAPGIGSGYMGMCGNITITKDVERVTAAKGSESPNSIGAAQEGTCGTVTIGDKVGEVSTSPYTYPEIIDLAALTDNYTAQNKETLTGTLKANVKVSIADGTAIILCDVAINSVKNNKYKWAGISCEGDATLILEGNNTVRGFHGNYPGIYPAYGSTLTITGEGSLTASTNGNATGIGSGYNNIPSGNIVLEGGIITAIGGTWGAGIGGSKGSVCGSITIKDTITRVTATKGKRAPNIIGAGTTATAAE